MPFDGDPRPAALVIRQFEKISQIRKQLVREGLVKPEATARQVVDALRLALPTDLFSVDWPRTNPEPRGETQSAERRTPVPAAVPAAAGTPAAGG